jgi:parallel beta-helix repeat protein
MARRRWGAATFAIALLVSGGLAACHGGVHCGATITADLTLTEDLTNCPGDGLIIGADGVTIDLNGHVIDGDGAQPTANFASGSAGIRDRDHTGVAVFGGTIREFDNGVSLLGTRGATVRDLVISDIANGVRMVVGESNNIERIAVTSVATTGEAFLLINSATNRIVSNRNQFNEFGSGLVLQNADFNTVTGNRFTGNDSPNIVLIQADSNLVNANDASNSNTDGIQLSASNENRIVRNATDSEADGISLASSDQNSVIGNDAGDVLSVLDGSLNALDSNTARSIEVSGSSNDLSGNRVSGTSSTDGISVAAGGGGLPTQIRDNLVTDAGGDGIQVDEVGAVVADNTALRNGGYGIRAVVGVVDGGGNTARDNGEVGQCLNISCA